MEKQKSFVQIAKEKRNKKVSDLYRTLKNDYQLAAELYRAISIHAGISVPTVISILQEKGYVQKRKKSNK